MRPRVPWMNELDDAILELMASLETGDDKDITKNPKSVYLDLAVIRNQTEKSPKTISRRMGRLEDMGMLHRLDTSGKYYVITQMGRDYLSGDLSSEDIPQPSDE